MATRSTSSDSVSEEEEAPSQRRAAVLVLTGVAVVGLTVMAVRLRARAGAAAQRPERHAELLAEQARLKLMEIQASLDSFRQLINREAMSSE